MGVEEKRCLALRGGGLLLFITFCIFVPCKDYINTARNRETGPDMTISHRVFLALFSGVHGQKQVLV